MFSVGATPFNSNARQIYGGWTAAQAGDNLWGLYKANSMQARYGPTTGPGAAATAAAKEWMKNWRRASKRNPAGTRAALRAAAGDWLRQRKRRPLSPEQKAEILAGWDAIPFEVNPENAYNVSLYSGATYPSWARLITSPELTYPKVVPDMRVQEDLGQNTGEVLATDGAYFADYDAYRQALRDRLAAARAARGQAPINNAMLRAINAMMPDRDRRGRALVKFEV